MPDTSGVHDQIMSLLTNLTDAQRLEVPDLHDGWHGGKLCTVGYVVKYNGTLYRCLQAHTSQDGWEPNKAPSLWAKVLIPDADVIPEWEQPDSTNPYMAGDKVAHNGKTWQSTVDNNVWEPGVYGWEEVA